MRSIIVLLLGCVFVVGCSKDEAPAPTAAPASDSTGVAECDDYFKKADACFAKDPAQKAAMATRLGEMRAAFRAQAAQEGGKERLKGQCADHISRLPPNCK